MAKGSNATKMAPFTTASLSTAEKMELVSLHTPMAPNTRVNSLTISYKERGHSEAKLISTRANGKQAKCMELDGVSGEMVRVRLLLNI